MSTAAKKAAAKKAPAPRPAKRRTTDNDLVGMIRGTIATVAEAIDQRAQELVAMPLDDESIGEAMKIAKELSPVLGNIRRVDDASRRLTPDMVRKYLRELPDDERRGLLAEFVPGARESVFGS